MISDQWSIHSSIKHQTKVKNAQKKHIKYLFFYSTKSPKRCSSSQETSCWLIFYRSANQSIRVQLIVLSLKAFCFPEESPLKEAESLMFPSCQWTQLDSAFKHRQRRPLIGRWPAGRHESSAQFSANVCEAAGRGFPIDERRGKQPVLRVVDGQSCNKSEFDLSGLLLDFDLLDVVLRSSEPIRSQENKASHRTCYSCSEAQQQGCVQEEAFVSWTLTLSSRTQREEPDWLVNQNKANKLWLTLSHTCDHSPPSPLNHHRRRDAARWSVKSETESGQVISNDSSIQTSTERCDGFSFNLSNADRSTRLHLTIQRF